MKFRKMMTRSLCLLLVLLSINLPTAFAAKGVYYVNASAVYARSGPSSGYGVKKKLHRGDVVSYKKSKNGWYYVKYSGGAGWVYRKYLSSVGSTKSSIKSSGKYKATGTLNMRSRASNSAGIIGKLKKGATVTIKKQSHGYAYVTYKGVSGWVAAKYLKRL